MKRMHTVKKIPLPLVWIQNMYEKRLKDKQEQLKREEFMKDYRQAQLELNAARNNYNFAKEPALLDYYIYEIKAAETRLNYFLKLAKKEQLSNAYTVCGSCVRTRERGEEAT